VSSKLGLDEDIYVVGANDAVPKTLQDVGILESFQVLDTYDAGMPAGTS
jgi:hypothetical protein